MAAIEKLIDFWPEWNIGPQIGSDPYGNVYCISRNIDGKSMYSAVKIISIPQTSSDIDKIRSEGYDEQSIYNYFHKAVQDCIGEISLMKDLQGTSNIVSVEDYYVYEHTDEIRWDIFIRTEYLTCLYDIINQNCFDEKTVCRLGIDICQAISFYEKRNIIDQDIRPSTIYMSKDGEFKLGDFGNTRILSHTTGTISSNDEYDYMAPELFSQKSSDSSVKLYALGIVMYKLLNNNRIPFIDAESASVSISDMEQARRDRLAGEYLPAPAYASTEMSIAILDACRFDPSQRYRSADEMCSHLQKILNNDPLVDGSAHVIVGSVPTQVLRKTQNLDSINSSSIEWHIKATEHTDDVPIIPPVPAAPAKEPFNVPIIASILVCCISLFIIGFLIASKIFDDGTGSSTSVNTSRRNENAPVSESVASEEISISDPTPTYIPTAVPAKDVSAATDSPAKNDTTEVINQNSNTNSDAPSSVDNIVYIADVYESLTLRNAPSTSAAALCLLPPFTELYITEFTNDTMVKVITIGTEYTGYVNKNYLARKGTVTQRAGKSKPVASTGPIYYADVYDFLTLRNAPSTSAGEIDRLLPFTAMRVESWNNGMAYVTVLETNQTGYVNGDYITADPNSTKRAGKSKSPINMTGHGFSVGNYCYADVEEYLTLRNAPSTSAGELARLPDDTMMVILEINNDKMMKVYVVATGQTGYVNRGYVK